MNDELETLVRVENVSKKFCRDLKRSLWYGMKDLGNEILGRPHGGDGELRKDEFWAVKDVSFELKRGECLGLIGRNGAGKTTLLRMLNGLIKPDKGRVEMRGRVGALIALGAGFNPILTGRENIYVNASVLGLTKKEIAARFEEIVRFAELGDFIDAPVQSYSSGMYVRLGFSIAAHLDPDILLVDEILAVGDLSFSVRCLNRIANLRKNGTAIIFVSHNELQVREAAQRCILFHHGCGRIYDEIDSAFWEYNSIHQTFVENELNPDIGFIYDGPLKIKTIKINNDEISNPLRTGEDAIIDIFCVSSEGISNAGLELRFWSSTGQLLSILQSQSCNQFYTMRKGTNHFKIKINLLPLSPGRYRIAGGFRKNGEVLGWTRDLAWVEVARPYTCWMSSGLLMMQTTIQGPLQIETDIR